MKNSIEEDIEILEELRLRGYAMLLMKYEDRIKTNRKIDQALEHILSDYKRVLKDANRYKNMYEAEHEIHLVRNEQLDRKENAIIKCKELENENKTIKEANDYWRSRYCEISNNSIPIQKVKDKIEKEIKYHEKNILDIENITILKSKTAKEEAEIEFNKYAIVVLNKVLQELLGSEEE